MIIAVIGLENSIHTNKVLGWFVKRGHQVHMMGRETSKIPDVYYHNVDNINDSRPRIKRFLTGSIHIYLFPFRHINKHFAFNQLLKNIKADVLYSYTLLNRYPAPLGLFSDFHPYIITPWNGDLLWELHKTTQGLLPFKQRYLIKRAIRKADYLTASTLAMRDSWLKHGASPSKVTMVVDPGTDTNLFSPRTRMNKLRQELGLGDCPVVLSTRSLGHFYNIDIIVRSIPKVLSNIPDAKFIFIWYAAGENELKYIKDLIIQLKISHAVRLIGTVKDYSKVPEYFNMSDVFVSLSSCDTIPNSLLEAMASGIPPVCAELPPIIEWITNGENGFIVPQRDADATALSIIKLLENPSLRDRFSKINLKMVKEKADFEKQMIKLENIFKNLLNREKS